MCRVEKAAVTERETVIVTLLFLCRVPRPPTAGCVEIIVLLHIYLFGFGLVCANDFFTFRPSGQAVVLGIFPSPRRCLSSVSSVVRCQDSSTNVLLLRF